MRVLVACEYSGTVRDAFLRRGHDAISCDLLPTDAPGPHYQGDVRDVLGNGWDLMICHPPCTHLAVSGARHFKKKRETGEQQASLDFVRLLLEAPIPHICLENPVSIISSRIRKPDQVIQPWMFGHGETKATCFWLRGLPLLQRTHRRGDLFCAEEPTERVQRLHRLSPGPNRWKERSRTFAGVASAMADQWGEVRQIEISATQANSTCNPA
jgi:site-specific DNA-cytosine methylase